MRLDKFLKVSRIVKRRTVANELCSAGRVKLNDKVAKPSTEIQIGDIMEMRFGEKVTRFEILRINEYSKKEQASEMFKIL